MAKDSVIQYGIYCITIHWIITAKTYWGIRWIMINPMSESAIQRRYHNPSGKYKYFQNLLISAVESDLYNGLCYPGDKSLLSYVVDSYLSNG